MEVDDEALLVVGEEAALEVGAEVVGPAEAAALAAAQQPRHLGHGAPAAAPAVAEDEAHELLVLLRRPRAALHAQLVAARLPPHRSALPEPEPAEMDGATIRTNLAGRECDGGS